MRKNKLSYIFTILTIICIFSVAAIADQCGCRATPVEEKIDVGETKETAEEEVSSEVEEGTSEEAEEEQSEETTEEEELAEEKTSEEEEEVEEETPEEEEQEAPTITLEIYEGPIYSSADDVCYYRIKATVKGDPTPSIVFSKDDSGGAWGKYKTQVNLNDPANTYTLIATATNSEGTATDSLDLSWGCNRPPVISDITIYSESGNINPGQQYEVSVEASDPEGDSLEYEWRVSGGKIDSPSINPTQWMTPSSTGEYEIEVNVEDGSGGMATMAETVIISQLELQTDINLSITEVNSGFIVCNQQAITGGNFYTGDSNTNAHCRGYLSFDITGLSGAAIDAATIYFDNKRIEDNPSFFKVFLIYSANYGPTLGLSDYNSFSVLISSYPLSTGPDFSCSDTKLNTELQQAIDSGRDRFQIMIDINGTLTDVDGIYDGLLYDTSGVNLSVDYTP